MFVNVFGIKKHVVPNLLSFLVMPWQQNKIQMLNVYILMMLLVADFSAVCTILAATSMPAFFLPWGQWERDHLFCCGSPCHHDNMAHCGHTWSKHISFLTYLTLSTGSLASVGQGKVITTVYKRTFLVGQCMKLPVHDAFLVVKELSIQSTAIWKTVRVQSLLCCLLFSLPLY